MFYFLLEIYSVAKYPLFITAFNYPFKTHAQFWFSQLQVLKQQDSNVKKNDAINLVS